MANVASQLALYPLYGSTAASMHFETMSLAVCMLASFIPLPVSMERMAWTALSVIIPASPLLLYVAGSRTALWNNPIWGPVMAQTVSSIPIQLLANLIITARIVSLFEYLFLEELKRCVGYIGAFFMWILPLYVYQTYGWICLLVRACQGGPSLVGLFISMGRI
jgi:hypothetical protein